HLSGRLEIAQEERGNGGDAELAATGARRGHERGVDQPFHRAGDLGALGDVVDRELRSEEHTSELQSRGHLVCRLLREKKKIRVAVGGNTDFLNMVEHILVDSHTGSVAISVPSRLEGELAPLNIHIRTSDYIPWLTDLT